MEAEFVWWNQIRANGNHKFLSLSHLQSSKSIKWECSRTGSVIFISKPSAEWNEGFMDFQKNRTTENRINLCYPLTIRRHGTRQPSVDSPESLLNDLSQFLSFNMLHDSK
jgi:hypothetical protein